MDLETFALSFLAPPEILPFILYTREGFFFVVPNWVFPDFFPNLPIMDFPSFGDPLIGFLVLVWTFGCGFAVIAFGFVAIVFGSGFFCAPP